MNKKVNLILASFIFGGIATFLPVPIKVGVFGALSIVLFMNYDEWIIQERGAA